MRTGCVLLGAITSVVILILILTPLEADDTTFGSAQRHENPLELSGPEKRTRDSRDWGSRAEGAVPCATYANGCSIPTFALGIFEQDMIKVMTPSCNKHDMCYRCGVVNQVSRWHCDKDFLKDMHKTCDKLTASQISASRPLSESVRVCRGTARVFYLAVAVFASSSYATNPSRAPQYCPDVKHCISSLKVSL